MLKKQLLVSLCTSFIVFDMKEALADVSRNKNQTGRSVVYFSQNSGKMMEMKADECVEILLELLVVVAR